MTVPEAREEANSFGLAVQRSGSPADVDNNLVEVRFISETTGAMIFERPATRVGLGLYEITLTTTESQDNHGNFTIEWRYAIDGVAEVYATQVTLGVDEPDYDVLVPDMQAVVDSVWFRFADLFDSPTGGPHLQTYFQTHWSRNRMAQLLRVAMGLLNTTAQPFQTYSLAEGGKAFPVAQWGALLESALYVEALKHLRRSYTEQPQFMGGNVTRLDRRDYFDRWGIVLEEERATLKSQLEVFKISNMGLGKPKVLVSGGVYGRFGPNRLPGSAAARPRYWTRFY